MTSCPASLVRTHMMQTSVCAAVVVQRVYINPDAVDDALVDLIHTPSGQHLGFCIALVINRMHASLAQDSIPLRLSCQSTGHSRATPALYRSCNDSFMFQCPFRISVDSTSHLMQRRRELWRPLCL